MNCMKCGKEFKETGVFCKECLADMEKYPVQSNVTVQLPLRRPTPSVRKKNRRQRYIKAEDHIRHLKKVRNWLICILISVILLFSACIFLILSHPETVEDLGIGQNYSTYESDE